jgi:hypothetical protein
MTVASLNDVELREALEELARALGDRISFAEADRRASGFACKGSDAAMRQVLSEGRSLVRRLPIEGARADLEPAEQVEQARANDRSDEPAARVLTRDGQ